jgi:hypothetical protein
MTRILRCLVSFTTTFTLSAGIHHLLRAKPALEVDRTQLEMIPPVPGPVLVANPSPTPIVNSVSRISQEAVIRFPQIGAVRVSANEGKNMELKFIDQKSGRQILTSSLGSYHWYRSDDPADADWNPQLRFKAISIKGLPSPLVIGIAMDPGVSDSAWQGVAIGVVNGRLERLNWETLETSNEGGFFFGDLGHGLGLGAAQWDFVWGEDECHPPPHKYEVKLYKWNGQRFDWEKVIRTRAQYNSPRAALRACGFNFVNARDLIPEWAGINGLAEE